MLNILEVDMAKSMAYLTIRLDPELRAELEKAAELEKRSLSSFGRLLLEHGWSQYLRAGSLQELFKRQAEAILKGVQ